MAEYEVIIIRIKIWYLLSINFLKNISQIDIKYYLIEHLIISTRYIYCLILIMVRILLLLVTFSITSFVNAQDGVRFEHGLSWNEVVAKAAKENKYIMVDCYTSWCRPCKYMSEQVFPQKVAGDFFNTQFLSLKLQIDKTIKDDASIKAQYPDAAMFEKLYNIRAYPTFLFFSPKGVLVHISVGSGTVDEMINEGKNATNPDKAFYVLYKEYKEAKISTDHLYTLAKEAIDNRDENAPMLVKAYIRTQKNMFTKENVALLTSSVQSIKDTGFSIIEANEELYDNATQKGSSRKLLASIKANDPSETPKLKDTIKKGDNWSDIKTDLSSKMHLSKRILQLIKANYLESMHNGNALANAGTDYYNAYPDSCNAELLDKWARTIFLYSNGKDLLNKGLLLSKASVNRNAQPDNMETYACILYRLGNVEDAIKWETKARNIAVNNKNQYDAKIANMKAGKKIWETMK